jgi:hypothetical protein
MRGRGSKQIRIAKCGGRGMSPLMRGRQPRSGGSAYQGALERMCVIRTAARIPLVRRAMRKYIRGIYFQEESRDRSIPQMG